MLVSLNFYFIRESIGIKEVEVQEATLDQLAHSKKDPTKDTTKKGIRILARMNEDVIGRIVLIGHA